MLKLKTDTCSNKRRRCIWLQLQNSKIFESRVRLVKALKEQNEAAKKRNKEFLEEVLVDRDICKPQVTLHCKLHC